MQATIKNRMRCVQCICRIEGDNFDFILNPTYFGDRPIGFFDGVAVGGNYGIGVFIKPSRGHFLKIHLDIGSITNYKEELLGL